MEGINNNIDNNESKIEAAATNNNISNNESKTEIVRKARLKIFDPKWKCCLVE